MITEEREQEPYIFRRSDVEIPNFSIIDKNVRNEKKHKETCLKARKKRKKKRK